MPLLGLLPNSAPVWDREYQDREAKHRERSASASVIAAVACAPPYGQRKGWMPSNDFGDGGAFPEVHIPQYPLNMGRKGKETTRNNALTVQLDQDGKVKYDLIARQGHSKDKIVYSKRTDLLPAEILSENDPSLQKPSQEEAEETTQRTKCALEKIIGYKIAAAMPTKSALKPGASQYIRYTPAQQSQAFNSGAKQRVIRIAEAQVDPMEPPKFATNKKIPRRAPSPPPPVMHSPPKRPTSNQIKEWRIPPCVSNWKNSRGFTIPLDKRLAADGRGLQQVHVNENFAKMSQALYIAERKAREAIEMRAQLEKKLATKEKERKEEHLRELAAKARIERAELKSAAAMDTKEEVRERNELREERHKERARERNLGSNKRSGLQRERERDISEQIALGLPAKSVNTTGDQEFDYRLFNTAKGMGSGFGRDDDYNVYDKPWRDSSSIGSHIYRPGKHILQDNNDEDLQRLKKNRFVPDKEFSGTDRAGAARSGPVQFEKEEEDPFGLGQFFQEAKRAGSTTKTTTRTTETKRKREREPRKDDHCKRRKRLGV